MSYESNHFDVIIDKGTLDALLPGAEVVSKTTEIGKKVLLESLRVLKPMGRLLIVSLAQKQITETIRSTLESLNEFTALARAHTLPPSSKKSAFSLPVFVFVLMKMPIKKAPVYELQSRPGPNIDALVKCPTGEIWCSGILSHQMTQYNIRKANSQFPPKVPLKEHFDILMELDRGCIFKVGGFRLFVVDKPPPSALKFAIFVAPCGREIDPLFSTAEGRNRLADAVSADRLIICTILPNDTYDAGVDEYPTEIALNDITAILNEVVIELAPPHFIPNTDQAPYLTESAKETNGPKDIQILGSMVSKYTSSNKLAQCVSIVSTIGACRQRKTANKKKNKPKQPVEGEIIFQRIIENKSQHFSCIAQTCMTHEGKESWSCQSIPNTEKMMEVFGQFSEELSKPLQVLQIGYDGATLFRKLKINLGEKLSSWTVYCEKEEEFPELFSKSAKQDNRYKSVTSINSLDAIQNGNLLKIICYLYNFFLLGQITLVLLSCVFLKTIEKFEENITLFKNGSLVLVTCCHEPSKELRHLSEKIAQNFTKVKDEKSKIVEIDIMDFSV